LFRLSGFPHRPKAGGDREIVARELLSNQNQNAGHERQNSHHDSTNSDVKQRSDPDKNQINREQQHSNVFCHDESFFEAKSAALHA
jgi:hypothetical protein